jgi:hypothetical protein
MSDAPLLGVDATNVYVGGIPFGKNGIRAVAKKDGSLTTLTPPGQHMLGLVDGEWLYYHDALQPGSLLRVRISGAISAPEVVASDAAPESWVRGITRDDCAIYWTVASNFSQTSVTSKLMRKAR